MTFFILAIFCDWTLDDEIKQLSTYLANLLDKERVYV